MAVVRLRGNGERGGTGVLVAASLAHPVGGVVRRTVFCQWNVPLVDQHWAGFVMLFSGLPVQVAGIWHLMGRSALRDLHYG